MKTAHLSVLLVLIVWFIATAGCSSSRHDQTDSSPNITLTFRHGWTLGHDRQIAGVLREAVERFERKRPGVKVLLVEADPTEHRERLLRREMVAGIPPDVFSLFGGEELVPYAEAGRLLDLADFVEAHGLAEQFYDLQAWQYDEGVYGLPIEGMAEPVYYNIRLFSQLGIPLAEDEATLEDVIAKLHAAGVIPFAIGNKDRWPGAMYFQYFLQRYTGDRDLGADMRDGCVDGDSFVQALADFENFLSMNPFPDQAGEWSMDEAIRLFIEGKAAMFLNGSWTISLFPESFQQQIGVIHLPLLWGMQNAAIAGGYTSGIGISANVAGERKEAALALLQELYSEEVQQQVVYQAQRFPSMRMHIDYSQTGQVYKGVADLLITRSTFLPYDNAFPLGMQEVLFDITARMIKGEFTAAEAAAQFEQGLALAGIKIGGDRDGTTVSCAGGG